MIRMITGRVDIERKNELMKEIQGEVIEQVIHLNEKNVVVMIQMMIA